MLDGRSLLLLVVVLGFWATLACSREVAAVSVRERYEKWMSDHGRVYENNDEKEKRFATFKKNVEYIDSFNKDGSKTFKLGVNQFSDRTEKEIREANYGIRMPEGWTSSSSRSTPFRYAEADASSIPASVNWVEMGAVTEVQDQGSCGCCWAFSAVGAMEGIVEIETGQLITLSKQQLVDCMTQNGCEGNWMYNAFDYVISNRGLDTESDYPYTGVEGTCNTNAESAATITGYEFVQGSNETALRVALANQPISVTIDSSSTEFVNYAGGIFDGSCGDGTNHAVTLVGYGTDNGMDYWLVKNSWGKRWGEEGYMRLKRGEGVSDGLCGIARYPVYPTLN